jgi:hypothetical protein
VLGELGGDEVLVRLLDRGVHLVLGRAVEHGRPGLEAEDLGGPAEVGLEDLPDVHPAGHAQRVEHDLDGRAVLEERHVLFGTIRAMTPLLPCRPAILSPTESWRLVAT